MESISREFAEADGWNRRGYKFRKLDKFGSMFGFHVRGSYRYQTKVGAVFTMIYLLLVMATFAYYIQKWVDMTRPKVTWNQYRTQAYPEIDLWKEDVHFYVLPLDTTKGHMLTWDKFWSSFTIYASVLDMSSHTIGTGDHWSDIPFQKCGEQEWAKALPDTDLSRKPILEYGICLNPLKMVKSKLARFKETLPIRGGASVGKQRVMITFYECLPGRALLTTGVPATCDAQWFGSGINMSIYEKTVNVKNYEQPIESDHVRIDFVTLAKTLRFEAQVSIKQLDLYTDVGRVFNDWKLDQVPTVQGFKKTTNEWSMGNVAGNYMMQGKMILADYKYGLEIRSSNEKTEIWRSYFTIISVFSGAGGL